MQQLGQGTYNCEKQKEFSDDFFSVICSKYPIVSGSYREAVLWRPGGNSGARQARVVQCVQLESPAGILTTCNTHPRAGSDPPSQFRNLESIVFNQFIPSYIPETIPPEAKNAYNASLRARLILTGDMNYVPNGTEKFTSVCSTSWLGTPLPKKTWQCDIDQVMTVNMAHASFAHQYPFRQQYLVSQGGYKDATRPWPTDHYGPIVALVSTQELTIPIGTAIPTIPPTSTIPEISPTVAVPTIHIQPSAITATPTATLPTVTTIPSVVPVTTVIATPVRTPIQSETTRNTAQELSNMQKESIFLLDYLLSYPPRVLKFLTEFDGTVQGHVKGMLP